MIEGNEVVYRDYIDISVAVATPKVGCPVALYDLLLRLPLPSRLQGLVVPVLRNVETMNYADIEKAIAELGQKVRWCPLSSTSAPVP